MRHGAQKGRVGGQYAAGFGQKRNAGDRGGIRVEGAYKNLTRPAGKKRIRRSSERLARSASRKIDPQNGGGEGKPPSAQRDPQKKAAPNENYKPNHKQGKRFHARSKRRRPLREGKCKFGLSKT